MIRRTLILMLLAVIALTGRPALAADYAPGLSYSSVLNGVLLLPESGQFRLNNIQAVFLPDPNNGEYNPYNPDSGAALWAVLSTASGEALYRFDFYAEKLKNPYWLLSAYKAKDAKSGAEVSSGFVDMKRPGSYVLDFYLDSGRFYSYPFSVSLLKSPDPFAGSDWYVLDGDWADWAYFMYPDANPEQSIAFKVWLRQREHGPRPTVVPLLEVKDSSGKLICNSRESFSIDLKPEWNRFEFDLVVPRGSEVYGQYFKAKDLLARDGAYTLTMSLDGKLYGTWKFSVSGGKFDYAGRALRGQADPLSFIEGGRDAFWYERN